jgi:hypothetical protein
MNVEICASKVVADNPSASAPQQGDTQMACIASRLRKNTFSVQVAFMTTFRRSLTVNEPTL